MCGTDLQDCFYQFKASDERVVRNHLACRLSRAEAAFVFDCDPGAFSEHGSYVLCGLSSLAKGDSSACEFAQCSRLGVLLQARAVHIGELLMQAHAPPRGLLSIGLVIGVSHLSFQLSPQSLGLRRPLDGLMPRWPGTIRLS